MNTLVIVLAILSLTTVVAGTANLVRLTRIALRQEKPARR